MLVMNTLLSRLRAAPRFFHRVSRLASRSQRIHARSVIRALGRPLSRMCLVLFLMGAALAQASAGLPGLHVFKLDNGMDVLIQVDRRAPTVVHMVWYRVGSLDEVDGQTGIAHIVEHMMFKGTRTLAPGEFSRRVAALGGRENAFTGTDMTGYFQQVPSDRLADVMRLEAERMGHLVIDDDEFAREMAVIKEERRLVTDDKPRARLWEQLRATAFIAAPVRRPIIGWMEDLQTMTPQDARDFYAQWYAPNNAALVVVGDVDPQAVLALAQETYGQLPARELPVRKPRAEPAQHGIKRITLRAPAEQAYLAMAWKVPHLTDIEQPGDAYALQLLAAVLDGHAAARLPRQLVQPQDRVADQAGAWYGLSGRGPQLFVMDGVPAQGRTVEELEAGLRSALARVATEGVDEAELWRVTAQLVSSEIFKLDSLYAQAQELGMAWVRGFAPDDRARLIQGLREVTPQQVRSVAQRYFNDDQLTVGVLEPLPMDAASVRAPSPLATQVR